MVNMTSLKDWTETGKNLFALLRDMVLFLLFVVIIFYPAQLGDWFGKSKLQSFKGFGIELQAAEQAKQQALAAGDAVAQSKTQTEATLQTLDEIVKQRPDLAAVVAPLQAQVSQSQKTLAAADNRLVSAVVNQQEALAKAGAPGAATLQGWVYLGSIDEGRTRWNRQNVSGAWPVSKGETRTVTDALYVRAAGAPNARATARALGAVQEGKTITIEDIDTSGHLRAGGWTVWARITAQP